MWEKLETWHWTMLVAIISVLSVLLFQQQVLAQWTPPDDVPSGTNLDHIVVTPMQEDLDVSNKKINAPSVDSNFVIDPSSSIDIKANKADFGELCIAGACNTTWPIGSGGSGGTSLWSTSTINSANIYYSGGNVGIGTDIPSSALQIKGSVADDANINLRSDLGDMKIIFQEYDSPPTPYGDISIRYNGDNPGINNGYANWLEFWGRDPVQGGGRPIMTMQRDYVPGEDNYFGVGIGVPAEENITARLRVQNYGTEDILQLYDDTNMVFQVSDGGNVGIGVNNPRATLDIVGDEMIIEDHSPEINFLDTDGNYNWRLGGGGDDHFSVIMTDKNDWDTYKYWSLVVRNDPALGLGDRSYVGIGTAQPLAPLHLAWSGQDLKIKPDEIFAEDSGITLKGAGDVSLVSNGVPSLTASGSNVGINGPVHTAVPLFINGSGSNGLKLYADGVYSYNNSVLSLKSTNDIYLDPGLSDGVGIEVFNPAQILHVKNPANSFADTLLRLENNNDGVSFSNQTTQVEFARGPNWATDYSWVGPTNESTFDIWTMENIPILFGNSGSEKMRITSTGNVGIGTTNPQGNLDIVGDVCLNGDCINSWPSTSGLSSYPVGCSIAGGVVNGSCSASCPVGSYTLTDWSCTGDYATCSQNSELGTCTTNISQTGPCTAVGTCTQIQ